MALSTRIFRIFVSSTFSDLKAERNALHERVFPRLRELCAARGCRFQAIDLRWGISEEAALDQQTMNICLGEIARCQKTSPRPNFIVLLGNRYGWRPLPAEIPAMEFKQILAKAPSPEDRMLLELWYQSDDNAIPATYCLQPRTGQYEVYETWEPVEQRLHSVLEIASTQLSLFPDERLKYHASATEQEIVAGAMRVADAIDHVFCYFREIEDLPQEKGAEGFLDLDAQGDVDIRATKMLTDLKSRLSERLRDNVHTYTSHWQGIGPRLDHLPQLCEDVYHDLEKVILTEIALLEEVDPLAHDINAHESFGRERARHFTGRTEVLGAIADHLRSAGGHPLVVWGESGSGKSALMAKALQQAKEAHPQATLIYRFIGVTPESSNGRALLEGLCHQIIRCYGGDDDSIPSDYRELIQEFQKCLMHATADRPLFLFLDALDQLSNADNARSLIWLPSELNPHVHLVVSTLPGDCLNILRAKLPIGNLVEVRSMSEGEGEALLELWLAEAGRRLQEKQRQLVLDNFKQDGLPLYLKLAFEEARHWKSYNPLPKLTADIPGMIQQMFQRLSLESNHGEVLVSRSLAYLAAAKNGLSEDELLDLLSLDERVIADFLRRSPKSPRVERLPTVIWSRLYFDLADHLVERLADQANLLTFYHRQLADAAHQMFCSGEIQMQRSRSLATYFEAQPTWHGSGQSRQPNFRKVSELPYQQAQAGLTEKLTQLLSTFDFLYAKLTAFGPQILIEDYDLFSLPGMPKLGMGRQPPEGLRLIQMALRLSAHVLARDHNQLPGQLVGRLMTQDSPEIRALLEQAKGWKGAPWVRPLTATLTQAGGSLIRVLEGHTGPVAAVAVTPNGRWIISGSHDYTLRVWELETGAEVHNLQGHKGKVWSVAVTPDGRRAVSASFDHTLKVWDLEGGMEIHTLKGHSSDVNKVAMTPDGQRAVSASDDRTLRVWDLESGAQMHNLEGHTRKVYSLVVSPDGGLAVSASDDHTLKVWDIERGQVLHTLQGHTGGILAVSISADGRHALSASMDSTLKLWNLEDGKEIYTLHGHEGCATAVVITSDGQRAVSASQDKTVRVWDLTNGKEMRALLGHQDWVNSVALILDEQRTISGSRDGTIRVWSLESGEEVQKLENAGGVTGCVFAMSPDGQRLISGAPDNTLKIWDLQNREGAHSLKRHAEMIYDVAVTPDGRSAISASADNTLKVWDLDRGQEVHTMHGHSGFVMAVAISPDGQRAVSASYDKSLKVWDLKSGQEIFTLEGHIRYIETVAITPDGGRAVSGGWDGLRVWDLDRGVQMFSLEGHRGIVYAVAVTPDGRRAVSGSDDWTLKVWDLDRGQEECTLHGHSGAVMAVEISPDGRRAISASVDKSLRVWDLRSGGEMLTLEGHTQWIDKMAVTPDGRRVVSGALDGLRVWSLDRGEELFSLKDRMGRVHGVVATLDGRHALSGSEDKTLKVWDLKTGKEITSFAAEGVVGTLAVGPRMATVVAGDWLGGVHILHLENLPPGPAIATARRIWCHGWKGIAGQWQSTIQAGCPWCGERFPVADEVLEVIKGIERQAGLSLDQSPCLDLPEDVWDTAGLLSECPHCHRPLMFNPFIVDHSVDSISDIAAHAG
jgi:WD40 repeat protein